jgi:predicted dehydrogenase
MKVGIVGAGVISRIHLAAIARYPGAHVVGIADRDVARARVQAERFGIGGVFPSLGELMAATSPDVVHVLTPPDTHAPLAVEALGAGAHVCVEKPMAVTEAECERMAVAADRAGRQLCVGHSWLYTAPLLEAQRLIASGIAGEVVQASASFTFDLRRNPDIAPGHWSRQLPGGIAEDLAVHPVAALIRLLGTPRSAMSLTRSGSILGSGQTEEMRAVIDGERGPGTAAVSLGSQPDLALVDIWCRRMLLRLNLSSMVLTVTRDLPGPRKLGRGLSNFHLAAQLTGRTVGATWQLLRKKVDGSYGITPLIHAFYKALDAGKPTPVNPREGVEAVKVLRTIWPQPLETERDPVLAARAALS